MAHEIYELTQNGKRIHAGSNSSCWMTLQKVQSHSADYAMRYDGYKVSELECSEEEAQKIIAADKFWEIEVILDEDLRSLTNHNVKVTTLDGKPVTANTYGMRYGATTKGTHVFVTRFCLSIN